MYNWLCLAYKYKTRDMTSAHRKRLAWDITDKHRQVSRAKGMLQPFTVTNLGGLKGTTRH